MEPPTKRRKPAPRRSARLQSGGGSAASDAAPSPSASAIEATDDLGQRGAKRKRGGASGTEVADHLEVVPASVTERASLDAQLAPLEGEAQNEMKRKRDEVERPARSTATSSTSSTSHSELSISSEGVEVTAARSIRSSRSSSPRLLSSPPVSSPTYVYTRAFARAPHKCSQAGLQGATHISTPLRRSGNTSRHTRSVDHTHSALAEPERAESTRCIRPAASCGLCACL